MTIRPWPSWLGFSVGLVAGEGLATASAAIAKLPYQALDCQGPGGEVDQFGRGSCANRGRCRFGEGPKADGGGHGVIQHEWLER